MREMAGVIQKEVGTLTEDIGRLDGRIESLSRHFKQANEDIDGIRFLPAKLPNVFSGLRIFNSAKTEKIFRIKILRQLFHILHNSCRKHSSQMEFGY